MLCVTYYSKYLKALPCLFLCYQPFKVDQYSFLSILYNYTERHRKVNIMHALSNLIAHVRLFYGHTQFHIHGTGLCIFIKRQLFTEPLKPLLVRSASEPCHEKTNILHMRKQRRKSASR